VNKEIINVFDRQLIKFKLSTWPFCRVVLRQLKKDGGGCASLVPGARWR